MGRYSATEGPASAGAGPTAPT